MRTIWIGEVFNEAPPPPDVGPHAKWTPFIDLNDLHRLLAHLRDVLKREAAALEDVHVDVDKSRLGSRYAVDADALLRQGCPGRLRAMIAPDHRQRLQLTHVKSLALFSDGVEGLPLQIHRVGRS